MELGFEFLASFTCLLNNFLADNKWRTTAFSERFLLWPFHFYYVVQLLQMYVMLLSYDE